MAASFLALWGSPPAIDNDGAKVVEGLWMYIHPKGSPRLSCGLYRTPAGDLVLRTFRNRFGYREWYGEEPALRQQADICRRLLEHAGWLAQ